MISDLETITLVIVLGMALIALLLSVLHDHIRYRQERRRQAHLIDSWRINLTPHFKGRRKNQ